ncbi:hypothetical protein B0O99DRAFT_602687 [Bisporella sp. PMI_857]|nr:hypothetical protein B0O99DRAFT_602687 [Bisporella sp. PMI_857]
MAPPVKRKYESHAGDDSMGWVDPQVVMSKVKTLDIQFLHSLLVSAYNSSVQTRRAIDLEYERAKRVKIAREAAHMNMHSAPQISTMFNNNEVLVSERSLAVTSSSMAGATSGTGPESPKVAGYKYNTPTAVAKRNVKAARQQGLPVYCSGCNTREPSDVKKLWQVPNGGDGLLCPDCRNKGDMPKTKNRESDSG